MKNALKKRYLNWEPIKNPVLQNTILGLVLGLVVGYNLKILYSRINGPAFAWISFFIFGLVVGFLSGLERYRIEKKKDGKKSAS